MNKFYDLKKNFNKKFFTTQKILILIIVFLILIILFQNINRYRWNNSYKSLDRWSETNSNLRIPGMGWWAMGWGTRGTRSFSR